MDSSAAAALSDRTGECGSTVNGGRPYSLVETSPSKTVQVIVNRDENGYGMKVSGDNPVYVQSVKQGGAAEKAGLHAGDKIIKVNGTNVTQFSHTEVVALIRAYSQVVLTVQPRPQRSSMGSPGMPHSRQHTSRITGPRPVDNEKRRQFEQDRVHTYRLMLEKERRFVDTLRSELARNKDDEKRQAELLQSEKNIDKLESNLEALLATLDAEPSSPYPSLKPPSSVMTLPPKSKGGAPPSQPPRLPHSLSAPSGAFACADTPPPLPERNKVPQEAAEVRNLRTVLKEGYSKVANASPNHRRKGSSSGQPGKVRKSKQRHHQEKGRPDKKASPSDLNPILEDEARPGQGSSAPDPPPLPPRNPPQPNNETTPETDAVNSLNKQMFYPLVATCTPVVDSYPSSFGMHSANHQRTKSSPDHFPATSPLSPAEASRRLIAAESLSDLSRQQTEAWATPPGTPPPPYPSPLASKKQAAANASNRSSADAEDADSLPCEEGSAETTLEDSPVQCSEPHPVLVTGTPIIAASPNVTQQPIISMEDDDISDQEVGPMEDQGPFKSLSRLLEHHPHLAVFMNYVLSNSDPSSLLFYLLTGVYKEGNAKEMRKWAYEIHSSFLIPGAPLRLNNVDENIAREIDDVLAKEYDKEEILRKIFWKARNKAKEELNEQLADFQQKRRAGLGTIFGPTDAKLSEIKNDKSKEIKLYETVLLDKLEKENYDIEKVSTDSTRFITASALATVISKVFGVRSPHGQQSALDRYPTFVSKDKSLRTKLIGKYSRKQTVNGHPYVPQQYYSVKSCNHCHQIIIGIGPQGFRCSDCHIDLHQRCIKLYDDSCPGPINNKRDRIGKIIDIIRPDSKEARRKPSTLSLTSDRKVVEEKENDLDPDLFGEKQSGQPVSRTGSDRRPDPLAEESSHCRDHTDNHDHEGDFSRDSFQYFPRAKSSQPGINRSESYKDQSQKRKREKRKVSDPNLSKTHDVGDLDQQGLTYPSGSSSSSSLSSNRSSESPRSASLEGPGGHLGWDSDVDAEPEPHDWQSYVSDELLARLHPQEKKRQEVINELFITEWSHVRNLKVLDIVFYRPILNNKCLSMEQVKLLFPNLDEMLELHSSLYNAMKTKRKEHSVISDIGDILLNTFDGSAGENFQRAVSTFCARQRLALESLKERRRKDPRLNSFLNDCESHKRCKRLQLKDLIPIVMQRLVKYPLLFENLVRCTERVLESTMVETPSPSEGPAPSSHQQAEPQSPSPAELIRLRRALERSKEILNHVNLAVKEADDCTRLQEIHRKLDKSAFDKPEHQEFRNFDLLSHKLIHAGPLLWRNGKQRLNLHVVLLDDMILLLQKQDEKYVLKSHITSPIVKLSTVLVRPNAADNNCLFLVNPSGAQIHELVASSSTECNKWIRFITESVEAYKSREGKSRRFELSSPYADSESSSALGADAEPLGDSQRSETAPAAESTSQRSASVFEDEPEEDRANADEAADGNGRLSNSNRQVHMRLITEDSALVQPSEVVTNSLPVHVAEPVLTPIEQVRRKDEAIRQALSDKEALVADILRIPQEHYPTIVDLAGEAPGDKEPVDLVLAAINQANLLMAAVNESLNITEDEPVIATGGLPAECCSNTTKLVNALPSIPSEKVQKMASAISSHLTTLLKVVKDREEEREKLRREMQRSRELEQKLALQQMSTNSDATHTDQGDQSNAEDLANVEVSPVSN